MKVARRIRWVAMFGLVVLSALGAVWDDGHAVPAHASATRPPPTVTSLPM